MVGHARWLLWEGYSDGFAKHPQDYSLAGKLGVYFFSLFKYGHEAVLFFFVLSGFVIHLRYARQLAAPVGGEVHFGWKEFVWRRVRRLYPPLLAAILLSFCLDSLGKSLGFPIYFQNTLYANINANIAPHLDLGTLGGNLAFLMQTYVPAFGTDGPLWSLKYEWWFYMIYPAFWWVSRRSWVAATAFMTGLFAASFWQSYWPLKLLQQVFSAMLIWWLGVVLADFYAGRIKLSWRMVVAGALGLGGAAFALGVGLRPLAVGCGFAALLAAGFGLEARGIRLSWLDKLKPLGDMSYTLYVTHFPVLVLLGGWLMSRNAGGLLPRHFGWVWAGIATTLVLAYGLHFIIEKPFLSRSRKHAV